MANLTDYQNTFAEVIWNKLEDANESRGSLVAAIQDRIGILGDFLTRYFQEDTEVLTSIKALVVVADKLGQNFEGLCGEMAEVNQFDMIDTVVKAEGGTEDDANAVQNMIGEQHWVALTAELRYLASANNDNDTINKLANVMDAAAKHFVNVLYA